MTCLGPSNVVNFVGMKDSLSYIGGGVIVAVMFLAVFVGGANAHHNGETEAPQKTEIKA